MQAEDIDTISPAALSPAEKSMAAFEKSLEQEQEGSMVEGGSRFPDVKGAEMDQTAQVDGKVFFKKARKRLSFEQFNAFLANIKQFNAHEQTREEALENASNIFGNDNQDLHQEFSNLLSRHGV